MNGELLYRKIGEKIKRIREAQSPRMSQEDLAKLLGLTRTSITNIENGNQKLTLDTIYTLCERFSLQVQDVLPTTADVAWSAEQSITVGGESHDVGVKTATLVARLRPDSR